MIVLDVKCGSGSFMKTVAQARELATEMVEIGKLAGRKTMACITDMDEPLGDAVGNALEVKEAIALLKGEFAGNLLELCLTLGAGILTGSGRFAGDGEARLALENGIRDGSALSKFVEFVAAQGGDRAAVYDVSKLPQAPVQISVQAMKKGYVNHIDAEAVGGVSMHLGGGRATKESKIDLSVGVVLHKKTGDYVNEHDSLATIHAPDADRAGEAAALLRSCYKISGERPEKKPFIKAVIK